MSWTHDKKYAELAFSRLHRKQVMDDVQILAAVEDFLCAAQSIVSNKGLKYEVRARIEAVLDWATARKYRAGENPARWKGLLENLLARPSKIARVKHHAALPYAEIGAFMAQLQAMEGVSPLALQFTILTAARTGEALGATWEEIDLGRDRPWKR